MWWWGNRGVAIIQAANCSGRLQANLVGLAKCTPSHIPADKINWTRSPDTGASERKADNSLRVDNGSSQAEPRPDYDVFKMRERGGVVTDNGIFKRRMLPAGVGKNAVIDPGLSTLPLVGST